MELVQLTECFTYGCQFLLVEDVNRRLNMSFKKIFLNSILKYDNDDEDDLVRRLYICPNHNIYHICKNIGQCILVDSQCVFSKLHYPNNYMNMWASSPFSTYGTGHHTVTSRERFQNMSIEILSAVNHLHSNLFDKDYFMKNVCEFLEANNFDTMSTNFPISNIIGDIHVLFTSFLQNDMQKRKMSFESQYKEIHDRFEDLCVVLHKELINFSNCISRKSPSSSVKMTSIDQAVNISAGESKKSLMKPNTDKKLTKTSLDFRKDVGLLVGAYILHQTRLFETSTNNYIGETNNITVSTTNTTNRMNKYKKSRDLILAKSIAATNTKGYWRTCKRVKSAKINLNDNNIGNKE